jgi:hypothetical protein
MVRVDGELHAPPAHTDVDGYVYEVEASNLVAHPAFSFKDKMRLQVADVGLRHFHFHQELPGVVTDEIIEVSFTDAKGSAATKRFKALVKPAAHGSRGNPHCLCYFY